MQNPATRPLVKSLMKVLSFLMGRRRKVVPKAMRKKVLMLVLQMLDLTNPTEVAIATYMTKNLVHGRGAADEFLLDWADVELVEVDGQGTLPCLREMTPNEMSDNADGSAEEHQASAVATTVEVAAERASEAAQEAVTQLGAAAATTGAEKHQRNPAMSSTRTCRGSPTARVPMLFSFPVALLALRPTPPSIPSASLSRRAVLPLVASGLVAIPAGPAFAQDGKCG